MAPKEGGGGAGELAESKSLDAVKGESAAIRNPRTQSARQGPGSALFAPISSPVLCVGFHCTKRPPMTATCRGHRSWPPAVPPDTELVPGPRDPSYPPPPQAPSHRYSLKWDQPWARCARDILSAI